MNSLNEDFKKFQTGPDSKNSKTLPYEFLKQVDKEINPSSLSVFSKVFLIHSVTASLSLLVCPQFGLQYFRHSIDITEFFYAFGEAGHHLACGFLFMSGSVLAASLLLSKDEVRKIREHRSLMIGSLIFLSMGLFAFISPGTIFESIALVWMLGAFLSSSLFLELGWKLRLN